MREPKRWDKQETAPTLFLFFDLELFILFIHGHSQGEFTGNTTIIIRMHIGKLIRQKMEERHKTVVWLAKELAYSRTNVYKMIKALLTLMCYCGSLSFLNMIFLDFILMK